MAVVERSEAGGSRVRAALAVAAKAVATSSVSAELYERQMVCRRPCHCRSHERGRLSKYTIGTEHLSHRRQMRTACVHDDRIVRVRGLR